MHLPGGHARREAREGHAPGAVPRARGAHGHGERRGAARGLLERAVPGPAGRGHRGGEGPRGSALPPGAPAPRGRPARGEGGARSGRSARGPAEGHGRAPAAARTRDAPGGAVARVALVAGGGRVGARGGGGRVAGAHGALPRAPGAVPLGAGHALRAGARRMRPGRHPLQLQRRPARGPQRQDLQHRRQRLPRGGPDAGRGEPRLVALPAAFALAGAEGGRGAIARWGDLPPWGDPVRKGRARWWGVVFSLLGCGVDPWTPPLRNPEAGVGSPDAACNELRRCCTGPTGAQPCPAGLACVSGRCVSCPAGTQLCDGSCVELNSNAHCGRCNAICLAGQSCVREGTTAACRPAPCAGTQTRCGDGCVSPATDPMHCGGCGNRCVAPNAVAGCAAGQCQVAGCMPGFGDCDMTAANGCEANTSGDLAHCGGCGRACAVPNATAQCAAGRCALAACLADFGDCDGVSGNGCEVALRDSAQHCGRCNNRCAFANATAQCVAGACRLLACNAGFADCNGNPADGCEADLRGAAHCGRCGSACGPGEVCDGGACSLRCPTAQTACGGACVFLDRDPMHCGGCGNACPSANGVALCMARTCGISCSAGFGDCDGSAANGCEANTRTDPLHCGRCGNRCTFNNGAGACAAGVCRLMTCNAGFADCDGSEANGCEANTASSVLHCGACGRVCTLANASGACAMSACRVVSCSPGFLDCDREAANGCEVNARTDPTHCGMCGRACPPLANTTGPSCMVGLCAVLCLSGWGNCDGVSANGCETSTRESRLHCGGCGSECPMGRTCAMGMCVP
ncbi:MAG: hypothetical protein HY909_20550 [Deltaproteobacteria bacterium]|nr:hypothetical protein [Deltaproteobacteria bacterium]